MSCILLSFTMDYAKMIIVLNILLRMKCLYELIQDLSEFSIIFFPTF